MRIPRHWRLNAQRYALQGVTCEHCNSNIFPPREVCPYCESKVEPAFVFEVVKTNKISAALEPAAR